MSDNTPAPRRRIAGETAAPTPAKKAAVAKKAPAKKTAAKKAPAKKSTAKQAPATKPAVAKKAPAVKKAPATKPAASVVSPADATPQVARPPARTAGPRRSRFDWIATAIASVMFAAGVVALVLGVNQVRGTSGSDARSDAVAAASSATETIFSFSYDALDEHTEEAKGVMTSSFAEQFDAIAPALNDIAPDRKVQVTAVTRNAAALPCGEECSATAVSVLVFIDQDRRLADDGTSTVFGNRIEVDMVQVDGDWKVDDIRAL